MPRRIQVLTINLYTQINSSVVLHFTSASEANRCLVDKIALHGHLHHTEKYRPQPLQCFNCYRFSHIASQCKRPAICGTCASDHPTSECHCPSKTPCKSYAKCTHLMFKCALRGGPHRATDPTLGAPFQVPPSQQARRKCRACRALPRH